MPEIKLYMAPGTCARVTAICLEEAQLKFETIVVRFMRGEHKSPDFKSINPKGKVPALVIDGEALTENVAIITHLDHSHPEAGLMPAAPNALTQARQLADLCFCAATLHPIVTRIRMPQMFAPKESMRSVWEAGCKSMDEYFGLINERLSGQSWWYGETWSAMDAYLFWIYWRCQGANYDVTPYPHFVSHAERMEKRPAVQRAVAREAAATAQLETEGLVFTPPAMN
ncbi:MAG: glutathione S-transferase family protein [Gammaproteobacteria bacterium]